jgi:outer membrane lipopolysaccharide assembly protein LptE/RlpB
MSDQQSATSGQFLEFARLPRALFVLLLLFLIPACGYHFSGADNLPQGIKRVSFAEVENQTLEVGIEKELQWALEREFRNHSGIPVAENAEGIINVTLHRLDLRPLSFDNKDEVLEYQLMLQFDISLTHRDTGQTLWQANNIQVIEDYAAIPQVVVTTSPKFLQGTLNPGDLPGLTDIQFSETERRLATARLFETAAREVYFRLGENF